MDLFFHIAVLYVKSSHFFISAASDSISDMKSQTSNYLSKKAMGNLF